MLSNREDWLEDAGSATLPLLPVESWRLPQAHGPPGYKQAPVSTSGALLWPRDSKNCQHSTQNSQPVPLILLGTLCSQHLSRECLLSTETETRNRAEALAARWAGRGQGLRSSHQSALPHVCSPTRPYFTGRKTGQLRVPECTCTPLPSGWGAPDPPACGAGAGPLSNSLPPRPPGSSVKERGQLRLQP